MERCQSSCFGSQYINGFSKIEIALVLASPISIDKVINLKFQGLDTKGS